MRLESWRELIEPVAKEGRPLWLPRQHLFVGANSMFALARTR